jgi:rhodanese-related sulfurtransferase
MTNDSYAGDIDPRTAWKMLQDEKDACLIDVRTEAEWRYVGVPDLASIDKQTRCISWLNFPDNDPNESFVEDVMTDGIRPEQTVLLLCRSGQRSRSAAIALTACGYGRCYNVSEGFEGDKDAAGHRGTVGGWKIGGLPWVQG